MNTHCMENNKYNDLLKVMPVVAVKGIGAARKGQILVQEPAVEIATFVGIPQYEIVHVRKVLEEH